MSVSLREKIRFYGLFVLHLFVTLYIFFFLVLAILNLFVDWQIPYYLVVFRVTLVTEGFFLLILAVLLKN